MTKEDFTRTEMLTTEQMEALAERLRGLLNLELPGEDYAYVLIFIERERYQKDNKEPTPILVASVGEKAAANIVKLTAKAL